MMKMTMKLTGFITLIGGVAVFAQSPTVPKIPKDVQKQVTDKATAEVNKAAGDLEVQAKVKALNATIGALKINFDYNSAALPAEGPQEKLVQSAAGTIREITAQIPAGYSLYIVGHASADGDETYNMELGKNRGQAVLERFSKAGVDTKNLKVQSMGEKFNKRQVTFEIKK